MKPEPITDCEILDELCRDLTNRWMRAATDGYDYQRLPEKLQDGALRRLRHAVQTLLGAEEVWDFNRWFGDQRTRDAAAALADAKAELRKLVDQ